MTRILKQLSEKCFNKQLQILLKQKKSKSQQRRSYFGKEPNGNYGTEKCNGNINLTGGGTVAEKR